MDDVFWIQVAGYGVSPINHPYHPVTSRQASMTYFLTAAGGLGVCIVLGADAPNFASMAARIEDTDAPELYICIESRATSIQTAHP